MEINYYDLLGVSQESSFAEIKAAFQAKALQCHPDKRADGDDGAFVLIQRAWEVLRATDTRHEYDQQLNLQRRRQAQTETLHVSDEVAVEEMDEEPDGSRSYACRCGDKFRLTQHDQDAGANILSCQSCSLRLRVVYASGT